MTPTCSESRARAPSREQTMHSRERCLTGGSQSQDAVHHAPRVLAPHQHTRRPFASPHSNTRDTLSHLSTVPASPTLASQQTSPNPLRRVIRPFSQYSTALSREKKKESKKECAWPRDPRLFPRWSIDPYLGQVDAQKRGASEPAIRRQFCVAGTAVRRPSESARRNRECCVCKAEDRRCTAAHLRGFCRFGELAWARSTD